MELTSERKIEIVLIVPNIYEGGIDLNDCDENSNQV